MKFLFFRLRIPFNISRLVKAGGHAFSVHSMKKKRLPFNGTAFSTKYSFGVV